MVEIKSKSDKRLIIEGLINNNTANFLIDTGASIALISKDAKKKYNLKCGKRYNGSIVGAGGELGDTYMCDTFPIINNKSFSQFIMVDISDIISSIKKETGIEIIGIISLPQMKFNGMQIDANDNLIIFE